jgi:hypothetical protein
MVCFFALAEFALRFAAETVETRICEAEKCLWIVTLLLHVLSRTMTATAARHVQD